MLANLDPSQRIVVTGMGCISPLGPDVNSTWRAIVNGQDGMRDIRRSHLEGYGQFRTAIGAPILDFDLFKGVFSKKEVESIHPKDLRRIHLSAQYALWAGAEALQQAGVVTDALEIDPSQINPDRFGVRIGTSIGGGEEIGTVRKTIDKSYALNDEGEFVEAEGKRVGPAPILQILPERVATVLSMAFKARGPASTIISACATGNANIISAQEKLMLHRADGMLAGSTDAVLGQTGIAIFEGAGAVDKSEDPATASRPFHTAKAGLIMGEGAGLLVMESLENATLRGAVVLAELVGVSETSDAHHETEPSGEGAVRAMREALAQTSITSEDTVYINAHGTGTKGDAIEMNAIKEVFSGKKVDGRTYYQEQVAGVSSTKGATGHLLAAASAVESITSIMALQEGVIPPNLKVDSETLIPETAGWNMSPDRATEVPEGIDYVINNSFGFGGLNAVTIWARPR